MITQYDIIKAAPSELKLIHQELVCQQMKLDKFFSVFLDDNELSADVDDTAEWFTYKEMLNEYDRVKALIKTTEYYIHDRP